VIICVTRETRWQNGGRRKKESYGAHRASERVSFEGRAGGNAPHSFLEKENEREEAHAEINDQYSAVLRFEDYTPDSYTLSKGKLRGGPRRDRKPKLFD
jgi:hypothetical protein